MRRWAVAVLCLTLLCAVMVGIGTHGQLWRMPDRHNPFAPLNVRETPNWLTRFKLSRLTNDASLCRSVLLDSGASAVPMADLDAGTGCGWNDAVRLRSLEGIALSSPTVLSCPAAVSLALWTQHVVKPTAAAQLGQPVRRLEHLGSYACRNVNGTAAGARSRHARAEALDVAAFTLQDGSRVSVLRDWTRNDSRGPFPHDVHDGACRWFNSALGPDYNRQHADHFHLERGPWHACR